MTQKSRGFTLTEILTTIAIIAVLASIIFPVFTAARKKADQTTCLSNLRQLGVSTFLYAQDNDNYFPYGGDPVDLYTDSWEFFDKGKYWDQAQSLYLLSDVMHPYVQNPLLWKCPSDTGFNEADWYENVDLPAHPSSYEAYGMSYSYTTMLAMNHDNLSGARAWSLHGQHSEHEYTSIPLLADMVGEWHGGPTYSQGRINMLFIDGHAQAVSRSQADSIYNIEFTRQNQSL